MKNIIALSGLIVLSLSLHADEPKKTDAATNFVLAGMNEELSELTAPEKALLQEIIAQSREHYEKEKAKTQATQNEAALAQATAGVECNRTLAQIVADSK